MDHYPPLHAVDPLRLAFARVSTLLLMAMMIPVAMAAERDVPGLPRVLIIGDSVSCGYTLALPAALTGLANVHRPPQHCGSTVVGLANLERRDRGNG